MWQNGVVLPTYPTFLVLKNHHFLTIFIGGGISIFSNFYENFWSIFWTQRTKYPILLAITLHFGAGGFYAYVLKISIFWAFLGRENMGQLFLYIYVYHCSGNTYTQFMVQNLCFHYFRSLGTVLLVKKRHPIYRGKKTGNSGFRPKLYNITTTRYANMDVSIIQSVINYTYYVVPHGYYITRVVFNHHFFIIPNFPLALWVHNSHALQSI